MIFLNIFFDKKAFKNGELFGNRLFGLVLLKVFRI